MLHLSRNKKSEKFRCFLLTRDIAASRESFKLYLGSEKDIEDAKHIYKLFQDKLDMRLLQEFNRKLKTQVLFNRYLK